MVLDEVVPHASALLDGVALHVHILCRRVLEARGGHVSMPLDLHDERVAQRQEGQVVDGRGLPAWYN